jgi:tetratricopeptide (TPR) repeat protein
MSFPKLKRITCASLTCFILSGGIIAHADSETISKSHDPFLDSMLKALDERKLSEAEMEKVSAYIQKHPDDPDGHLVMSDAYFKLGMTGMYAEELEKAWRLSSNSMLYLLAALKARMISDDPGSFYILVDEAFAKYKNDPKKLNSLGALFQQNNQNALALRFLKRATEAAPDNFEYLGNYCASLLAQKKYKQVIENAQTLYSNPQSKTSGALLLGVAYYNLNVPAKAIAYLSEAYAAAPTHAEIAEAYYDALMSNGRKAEATQVALMALATQPLLGTHMETLKNKIKPLIANASVTDIESGIKKVAAILPPGRALAYFYFALGDLLDKSGRYLNAVHCFSKGLEMDPSFGRAHMRLARDLEILGFRGDAVKQNYSLAAELTPPGDQEVMARYERMKERSKAEDRDIAGKLKKRFNKMRYGFTDATEE